MPNMNRRSPSLFKLFPLLGPSITGGYDILQLLSKLDFSGAPEVLLASWIELDTSGGNNEGPHCLETRFKRDVECFLEAYGFIWIWEN
jgi:hypothetical protein